MEYRAISFVQKLGLFHEQWQPKVIAEMNDYQFKAVSYTHLTLPTIYSV